MTVGNRLDALIDRIRDAKGPFFVARIHLRVRFPLDTEVTDTFEFEDEVIRACKALGFDATELRERV
jgi:hypothetical protein